MEKNYNVEVLYLNEATGLFRIVCSYHFSSRVSTTAGLKDIVRRDVKEMGYCPDVILIKNPDTGSSCVINCRKA